MKNYKVTMKEAYMSHPIEHKAVCRNEQEIIDFYGLNEPDIEWYKIEETKD